MRKQISSISISTLVEEILKISSSVLSFMEFLYLEFIYSYFANIDINVNPKSSKLGYFSFGNILTKFTPVSFFD